MRIAGLVTVLACLCRAVSSSDNKESCVGRTIRRIISDRTCGEVSGSEADIAAMAITGCLLRQFQKAPGCLDSGSKNCVKSLTPKVFSSYRAVRSKWSLLCDGAQQASVLERLREAVTHSEELLKQVQVAVEGVQKSAVKSVESGLRIEEAVNGVDGDIGHVVGEVEKAREFMDAEVSKVADRIDERVKSLNRKTEELCDSIRKMTRREVRTGGVIAGGYGCLGGIIVGCEKQWYGTFGGLLFLFAAVCELFGIYVWPVRLGLLSFCGWLVRSLDAYSNTSMERKSEAADDDDGHELVGQSSDDESDECDCCFDDHFDAH